MPRGPTLATRTRSIWVRRAVSTSASRSSSDVRQAGSSAPSRKYCFGVREVEDDDQDAVLFRGSLWCNGTRERRRYCSPGATVLADLDRMLHRRKRRPWL